MTTYRWGIIGPGKIAHKFAQGLQSVPHAELHAVASSSVERARAFANEYGVPHFYGSYIELVTNPEVDIIYIATTNNLHYEHARLCLEHSKACVCEKPFTLNTPQLLELTTIAQRQQTFLMEALWTMFMPSVATVKHLIETGAIGQVTHAHIDFGFEVPYSAESRLFSPELGGGALLDIGLYPVFLALHLFGEPQTIKAHMLKTELGIDVDDTIDFEYNHTLKVHIEASFTRNLPCEAIITGTHGEIRMKRMWHCPCTISLTNSEGTHDVTPIYSGNGYNYEIQEAQNCIANNLTQSSIMPHSFSILLMRYLDKIYTICS